MALARLWQILFMSRDVRLYCKAADGEMLTSIPCIIIAYDNCDCDIPMKKFNLWVFLSATQQPTPSLFKVVKPWYHMYILHCLLYVCTSSPVLQYHHHYHYDKKGHLWVPIRKTTLSQLELKRTSVASVFRLRSFCAGSVTTGPGFLSSSLLLTLLSEKPWHLPAQVGWH